MARHNAKNAATAAATTKAVLATLTEKVVARYGADRVEVRTYNTDGLNSHLNGTPTGSYEIDGVYVSVDVGQFGDTPYVYAKLDGELVREKKDSGFSYDTVLALIDTKLERRKASDEADRKNKADHAAILAALKTVGKPVDVDKHGLVTGVYPLSVDVSREGRASVRVTYGADEADKLVKLLKLLKDNGFIGIS